MRSSLVAAVATLLAVPLAAHAAPLAGRWEGPFHGGKGDQPVTLVLRPGAGGSLTGYFYLSGDLVGRLEDGTFTDDSLHFTVMKFACRAQRASDALSVEVSVPHGTSHTIALRLVSPDTTRLTQSPAVAAAARAKYAVAWDQVPDSVFAAHRLPPAAPFGAADALRKGTLLLVGGGPTQDDLNAEFVRLAGGAAARIVVIPTASVNPGEDADALRHADDWAHTLGVKSVTVIHTSSRQEADGEAFVKPLHDATGVWLPGGEAGRILVSYLGTRTERELVAVLARGGVIGGTSAGAMVWGSECQTFRMPEDGSPFQMGDVNALLLDDPHSVCFGALRQVVIAPHFSEFRMADPTAATVAARAWLLGIGIDEATALEVHGNQGTVLGRGAVTLVRSSNGHPSQQVMTAGAHFDLTQTATR